MRMPVRVVRGEKRQLEYNADGAQRHFDENYLVFSYVAFIKLYRR